MVIFVPVALQVNRSGPQPPLSGFPRAIGAPPPSLMWALFFPCVWGAAQNRSSLHICQVTEWQGPEIPARQEWPPTARDLRVQ